MLRSTALSTERILVLDDDESVAHFVGDALGVLGFQIELAHVPADAYLAAKNKRFDLIVSDVNLGASTGFEFRDRVRDLPGYVDTPFLFMSGADRDVEVAIAKSLGGDKLLIKPFTPAELRRAVFAL